MSTALDLLCRLTSSCFGDSFLILLFFFHCPIAFHFDSTRAVHLAKFGSPGDCERGKANSLRFISYVSDLVAFGHVAAAELTGKLVNVVVIWEQK